MRIIVFLLLLFWSHLAGAQATDVKPKLESPNVASLGKFGEIPVSLFTGTPDISLPLFSIGHKDFQFPLNLKYHPSNIKPNQRSGWVGLGWSLGSPTITREVKGFPDEFDIVGGTKIGYYYNRYLLGTDWASYATNNSNTTDIHSKDLEPDIFHFSVMGIQGTFFLDQNGTWKVQSDQFVSVELDRSVPLFVDPSIKSGFIESSGSVSKTFNRFILTDHYGNKYIFGGQNATEYGGDLTGQTSRSIGYLLRATAWHLVEAVSGTSGEKIIFEYERGPFVTNLFRFGSYNYMTNNSLGCSSTSSYDMHIGGGFISPVYLNKIKYGYQEISFQYSISNELNYTASQYGSLDFTGHNSGTISALEYITKYSDVNYYLKHNISLANYYDRVLWLKLDGISFKIKDKPIKSIALNYNNKSTERLFLSSLQISSSESGEKMNYRFSYKDSLTMPTYLQDYTDHWGFGNGINSPALFSPTAVDGQKAPSLTNALKGVLDTICFPTGGKTAFDYELGDYSKVVNRLNRKILTDENGIGGIRIKKITSYVHNNVVASQKEFKYQKNYFSKPQTSSGILNNKPRYNFVIVNGKDYENRSFSMSSYKTSSMDDLTDNNGIAIGYSEVTEISINGKDTTFINRVFTNHDNGFTDDAPTKVYNGDFLSNISVNSRSFERGRELKTIFYNNKRKPVKAKENIWISKFSQDSSSRAISYNSFDVGLACRSTGFFETSISYLNFYYPVILKRSIDTLYSDGDKIINAVDYEYSNYFRLTKKKIWKNSKNKNSEVLYTYPYDLAKLGGQSVFTLMRAEKFLNFPIETIEKEDGKVISAELIDYVQRKGRFVPNKYYGLKLASPLSAIDTAVINAQGGLVFDSNYSLDNEVSLSDDFGNPEEVRMKSEAMLSYQWGNNGQSPVAMVRNASNAQYEDKVYDDYLSISVPLNGSQSAVFTKNSNGPTSVQILSGSFTETNMTVYVTYKISGPVEVGGTFCLSNNVGSSCHPSNLNNSKININDLPMGNYTVSASVTYTGSNPNASVLLRVIYPKQYSTKIADKEFFYEGFEESSAGVMSLSAIGEKYYSGDYTVPFIMPNNKLYKIDYRYISNGSLFYISKNYTNNMILSEGDAIDEVRIYPQGAEMLTFTYDSFGSMTSKTDGKGITEFYRYDGLQRLKEVLNKDRSIIKSFDYHYRAK
ncbi:hypothetical protein LZQ00_01190 [Sphingobacterium sp. SRCM116780]|uniref:hypothetical protein n=1 Tax=Sphingobacterium sp. SRCM116780 TaxID=2907623 RepID=UPI001F1D9FFF|nr:hypothetical protein [Sphingobacterium sp. SRCM116780]UIR56447.1 hypothetical protein LZQ00_01190 [Sphingobacterium sp. SRCM116780]